MFPIPTPCDGGKSPERDGTPQLAFGSFLYGQAKRIRPQSFHIADGTNALNSSRGFHFNGKLQRHCSLWKIRFGGEDGVQLGIGSASNCILNERIKNGLSVEHNNTCRGRRAVEVIANERELLMRECTNPNNEMVKQKTDETLKQLLRMKMICNRWFPAGLDPLHLGKTHPLHNRMNCFYRVPSICELSNLV